MRFVIASCRACWVRWEDWTSRAAFTVCVSARSAASAAEARCSIEAEPSAVRASVTADAPPSRYLRRTSSPIAADAWDWSCSAWVISESMDAFSDFAARSCPSRTACSRTAVS